MRRRLRPHGPGVGEHAERYAGDSVRRLDYAATELLGTPERPRDVLHADEEQDSIVAALERADRRRGRPVDPDVDERVARERASDYVHPNRSPKNSRVASGSVERISA